MSSARFLAVSSIALVAIGLTSPRRTLVYAGIVLASVAIFAHGTVMPLVVVIPAQPLLFRRRSLFVASLLAPVGFFVMVVPYALGLIGVAEHNSSMLFAPYRVVEILRGAAILTGGGLTRDMAAALPIGAIGLGAGLAIGFAVARDILRNPGNISAGTVFFLGFGALSLADAFLAGVLAALRANYFGPGAFDYDSMMSSRYFMTATGVWVSIAALMTGFPGIWRARPASWAATGAVVVLALSIEIGSIAGLRGIDQSIFARRGHAALLAEVYDPETITMLIQPGDFQGEIPALNRMFKERHRNVHAVGVPEIASAQIKSFGPEQPMAEGCKFLAVVNVPHPPPVARGEYLL